MSIIRDSFKKNKEMNLNRQNKKHLSDIQFPEFFHDELLYQANLLTPKSLGITLTSLLELVCLIRIYTNDHHKESECMFISNNPIIM